MDYEKLIRRLRKKLREAQRLENCHRVLNSEESLKVSHISDYIEEIQELLSQQADSAPVAKLTHGVELQLPTEISNAGDYEQETSVFDETPSHSDSTYLENPLSSEVPYEKPASGSSFPMPSRSDPPGVSLSSSCKQPPSNPTKTLKNTTTKSLTFGVNDLQGHSDVIYCVASVDDLIVTGSRDGVVKVWNVDSGTVEGSFSSHTEAVTAVLVLNRLESVSVLKETLGLPAQEKSHLVISGSKDCHIKVHVVPECHEVLSVYTFSPVSRMCRLCFPPSTSSSCFHLNGLFFTSTDSGRIELWQLWDTAKSSLLDSTISESKPFMLYGQIHFTAPVISLQVVQYIGLEECDLLCASENGSIKMLHFHINVADMQKTQWNHDRMAQQGICSIIYQNCVHYLKTKNNLHGRKRIELNHLRTVVMLDGDHFLIGDDSHYLKILHRSTHEVVLLRNSIQSVSHCECICYFQESATSGSVGTELGLTGLVVSVALDTDTGNDLIHLFTWTGREEMLNYYGSLSRRQSHRHRILCVDKLQSESGKEFLLTAGSDLTTWQVVKKNSKEANKFSPVDSITSYRHDQLSLASLNLDVYESTSCTSSEEEDESEGHQDNAIQKKQSSSNSDSSSMASRCILL